jgi:hypothetical protein
MRALSGSANFIREDSGNQPQFFVQIPNQMNQF